MPTQMRDEEPDRRLEKDDERQAGRIESERRRKRFRKNPFKSHFQEKPGRRNSPSMIQRQKIDKVKWNRRFWAEH